MERPAHRRTPPQPPTRRSSLPLTLLSLLLLSQLPTCARAYTLPVVFRTYKILGGVVMSGPPHTNLRALARSYRAPSAGCHCVRKPSGGKCCTFTGRVPPIASSEKAPCTCRQCRPSYKCVPRKTSTFCVRRRVGSIPRCLDKSIRTGTSQCVHERADIGVLVPGSAPRSLNTRKGVKKVHPPTRRVSRRPRHRKSRKQRQRPGGKGRRRAKRPRRFDLFVAGHVRCWVYHGARRSTILQTRREAKVYHSANLPLRRCAPIRLKCRDGSRNRIGVMVAMKADGRFYGTGMRGTRCIASARRPSRWHSLKPQAKDETEVVRNMATAKETWQEMTELTGARPIRARRPFRSLFLYVVITPPFCGNDFEGPVL